MNEPLPTAASEDAEKVASATRSERAEREDTRRGVGAFFAELPVLVVIAFVLALLLKTFLVQAFYIPSESMLPTLAVGDRVLVNKVVYDLRDPRRGEVVVFSQRTPGAPATEGLVERALDAVTSGLGFTPSDERDFIKRVIGLPGETVAMRNGKVLINGQPLTEELSARGGYLADRDLTGFGPVVVPQNEYFVMGDNRLNSSDSRTLLGTIEGDEIIGRAFVVIWPFGRLGPLGLPDLDPQGLSLRAGGL